MILHFIFNKNKLVAKDLCIEWKGFTTGASAGIGVDSKKNSATHFGRYCRQNQLRRTSPTEYRPKYRATCYLEKLIVPGLPRGRLPTGDLSPPFPFVLEGSYP